MRIRWLVAGAVLVAAGGGATLLLGASRRHEPVEQPIPFDHQAHVVGQEMDCKDCHSAHEEPHAGFGAIRDCHECHKEVQGDADSELQQAVREYGKARRQVPWVQVTRNPGHVYFSHRAHVSLGKMECQECHGDMGARTTPLERPQGHLVSMDACMDCHAARGASLQCAACHD